MVIVSSVLIAETLVSLNPFFDAADFVFLGFNREAQSGGKWKEKRVDTEMLDGWSFDSKCSRLGWLNVNFPLFPLCSFLWTLVLPCKLILHRAWTLIQVCGVRLWWVGVCIDHIIHPNWANDQLIVHIFNSSRFKNTADINNELMHLIFHFCVSELKLTVWGNGAFITVYYQ